MGRQNSKLTVIKADKLKTKGLYADGGGLYLVVKESGAKNWLFRFMLNGKSREMGLGSYNDTPLVEAREKAADARKLLTQKIDPIEARKKSDAEKRLESAKTKTFGECAEAYIKSHQDAWKNAKHKYQWNATIQTYAYPIIENMPIQDVDVASVMKILEPIWKTKSETASRLRGRIESIIDWATAHEYRKGENPARWRGHLKNLLPSTSRIAKVVHLAALDYEKMSSFMAKLGARTEIAARALEFVILTATRTSETRNAKWCEFDFSKRVWTIPAERMKMGKEHKIYINDKLLSILEQMKKIKAGEYVFAGRKPSNSLSDMAMLMLLRRMKYDEITVHGFRSSFRDWAAEQTNYAREVAEASLAHAIGDKVEAAYRRGDLFEKRQLLMQEWAEYCYNDKIESK
jgi:integrase